MKHSHALHITADFVVCCRRQVRDQDGVEIIALGHLGHVVELPMCAVSQAGAESAPAEHDSRSPSSTDSQSTYLPVFVPHLKPFQAAACVCRRYPRDGCDESPAIHHCALTVSLSTTHDHPDMCERARIFQRSTFDPSDCHCPALASPILVQHSSKEPLNPSDRLCRLVSRTSSIRPEVVSHDRRASVSSASC